MSGTGYRGEIMRSPSSAGPQDSVHAAELLTRYPWHLTSLGPREAWDTALAATVDLVMGSPIAMVLLYGAERVLLYNDAYAELLGDSHPAAFGTAAAMEGDAGWSMSAVGPAVNDVFRTGQPYLEAEQALPRPTSGYGRNAFFTRGYSAVRGTTGDILGVLGVVADTSRATRRMQQFGELTTALAGAVTLDDVARTTLRHTLAAFDADYVSFAVDDGTGGWRTVRRNVGELIEEADERLPPLWHTVQAGSSVPLVQAAGDGVARYLANADLASYGIRGADRYAARLRAVAALPLRAASLRGAMTIGYTTDHPFLPAERTLLGTTARLVAQAANRARLFETQHGTAQLLQRSMLPQSLPALENCRIAARYGAGPGGVAAGGDFYDAFQLSDGRLAVALGDVSGHDVRAAALMGQVRAGLRALALVDPTPTTVLHGLDRLVDSLATELDSDELFVTVACGVVDPDAGNLVLASAGHPAPLLRRPGRVGAQAEVTVLEVPTGAPLGLDGEREPTTVRLLPGDTVVFFSDGAVHRRGRSVTDGLRILIDAVTKSDTGDPRSLCALLTQAVPGAVEDDVAVLALELCTASSRSATTEVAAEPTGPANTRRWLAEQLRAWDLPDDLVHTSVLCASELVTNALLHAGTPATVEVDLTSERLLVVVTDTGGRGPITRTSPEALASRGRGLNMIDSLADAWGSEPTINGTAVWFELLVVPRRG